MNTITNKKGQQHKMEILDMFEVDHPIVEVACFHRQFARIKKSRQYEIEIVCDTKRHPHFFQYNGLYEIKGFYKGCVVQSHGCRFKNYSRVRANLKTINLILDNISLKKM